MSMNSFGSENGKFCALVNNEGRRSLGSVEVDELVMDQHEISVRSGSD